MLPMKKDSLSPVEKPVNNIKRLPPKNIKNSTAFDIGAFLIASYHFVFKHTSLFFLSLFSISIFFDPSSVSGATLIVNCQHGQG